MDKKIIAILLIASLAIVSSKKHTVEENIKELSSEKHKKGHK